MASVTRLYARQLLQPIRNSQSRTTLSSSYRRISSQTSPSTPTIPFKTPAKTTLYQARTVATTAVKSTESGSAAPVSPPISAPTPVASSTSTATPTTPVPSKANSLAKEGLRDQPPLDLIDEEKNGAVDWTRSYHGLSLEPFPREIADILLEPLKEEDIEVKPDGILYLPEIKYRRVLNRAFGPGGWGLAPRGETIVTEKAVTREYALVCHGRLISIARGEQDYFDPTGIPTATEGCKSNALMRCCKDLGIASELWDPRYIRKFKRTYCVEVMTEHMMTKRRKKLWYKKGDVVEYPYKMV